MQSASSSSFSNKKTVVSFVLSLLVFFIHFQVFSSFAAADGILKSAFSVLDSLTHVGVPLFFAMSGALFYRNYTLASTTKKWKIRFFSLVIPYLVWNSIWLILALLGQYTPLGSLLGNVKATLSAETLFRGVFLHGMFKPFWFLLQLIVLTALCPLIYLLLKSKWIGASTILALYILYCTGLTRDTVLIPNLGWSLFI